MWILKRQHFKLYMKIIKIKNRNKKTDEKYKIVKNIIKTKITDKLLSKVIAIENRMKIVFSTIIMQKRSIL